MRQRKSKKDLLTLANESLDDAYCMFSVYGIGKQYDVVRDILNTLYYQQKIIHNIINENKKLRSEINKWQQQS